MIVITMDDTAALSSDSQDASIYLGETKIGTLEGNMNSKGINEVREMTTYTFANFDSVSGAKFIKIEAKNDAATKRLNFKEVKVYH